MIVYTCLHIFMFSGLILTTIANEIIEYLSFKNLPVAQEEFYNCFNNIEFDDNIQIDKDSLYIFLNDIRDRYVSGNLQPINTSKEVIKFIRGSVDLTLSKTSKELMKLIGLYEDLTLNKTSKELMNFKGGQTSIIIKDFEICCTKFHKRLFRVEEPILTGHSDIVAKALKKHSAAVNMLYDCIEKYSIFPGHLKYKLNDESFRQSTISDLKEVISKTRTLQSLVNRVPIHIFGNNYSNFAKYCSAAYYTFLISDNNGIFFSKTVEGIMSLITLKNLSRAKTALYNCFTNNNLIDFIKNRKSFDRFLNRLRKRILSADILPRNAHDEIIEFLKEDLSNFTNEIINCSTIFHSTLFEVTEPECLLELSQNGKILENENVDDLVSKRYDVAIDILYECYEKYRCFPGIKKKILNHKSFRESTICDLKEVISKTRTPQSLVNGVLVYIFGNNYNNFAKYCSAAYYTLITLDENRSRPWFILGEKYLASLKNVFRFPHQL
ncbi:uncharacterized protein LOC126894909 isoform X2 [Daktulosphaira vitifoliae]|uniref:uncharacterized protein LOC126894909 isoform X2 n=1 Tax=Daktulosphaira vitifoliae TaxID=58002 RepID=UPI0021A9B213|nr:uncharacterized protein LOC126894909 isoform X2 [Daktulosphaira vitifoliae]